MVDVLYGEHRALCPCRESLHRQHADTGLYLDEDHLARKEPFGHPLWLHTKHAPDEALVFIHQGRGKQLALKELAHELLRLAVGVHELTHELDGLLVAPAQAARTHGREPLRLRWRHRLPDWTKALQLVSVECGGACGRLPVLKESHASPSLHETRQVAALHSRGCAFEISQLWPQ